MNVVLKIKGLEKRWNIKALNQSMHLQYSAIQNLSSWFNWYNSSHLWHPNRKTTSACMFVAEERLGFMFDRAVGKLYRSVNWLKLRRSDAQWDWILSAGVWTEPNACACTVTATSLPFRSHSLDGPAGSQQVVTRGRVNCPVRNKKGCRAAVTPHSYFGRIFPK